MRNTAFGQLVINDDDHCWHEFKLVNLATYLGSTIRGLAKSSTRS
jgi:hypothetical protein